MTRFTRIALGAALALAAGCSKGQSDSSDDKDRATARPPAQPPAPAETSEGPAAVETLERYQACVVAFNRREVSEAAGCYATDSVQLTALDQPGGPDLRSPTKISEFLEASLSGAASAKRLPQVIVAAPDQVAAIVVRLPGRVLEAQLVWFDGGKIRRDLRLYDASSKSSETPGSEVKVALAKPEAADTVATRIQILENLNQALEDKATDTIAAHLADDVVYRRAAGGEPVTGKDAYVERLGSRSFGEGRERVGAMGAGDWVVTHSATVKDGEPAGAHRIEFVRFADSAIAEHWVFTGEPQPRSSDGPRDAE